MDSTAQPAPASWRERFAASRFGRFMRESRFVRFVRKYIWVYVAWRVLKFAVLGAVAYYGFNACDGGQGAAGTKQSHDGKETKVSTEQSQRDYIQVGDPAPDFTLPLYEAGKEPHDFSLADAAGKTLVLYFYPMDDTPGCTKQACGLRDAAADFAKYNALIVGVSQDDMDSHEKFAAKFSLPFGLLVDKDHELRQRFGNPDGSAELIARITYIIDGAGVVRHIIGGPEVTVDDHLAESAEWAKKLAEAK